MSSLEQTVKTHQHLWRLLRFQPGRYLFMTGTRVIIFMAIPHVLGFLTHQFFEGLTGGAMISFSPYAICAFVVAAGVARSCVIFIDIPNHFAAQFQAGALIRKNLIAAVLDRPGANALPDSTGEAISRFRGDVDQVTNYVSQLPFQVGNVLFAAVAFYVMFQIHALVSLVVFLPFLFAIVILNYTLHRVRRFRQASREAAGRVTGFIGEIFEDALAIKLGNAQNRIVTRLETLNEDRRRLTVRDSLFNRVVDSLIWNATNVGTGLVLVLVGSAMQEGAFSVGDFALFVYYLGFTSIVVQGSARTVAQYKQAGVAIDRLHALLQNDPQARLTEHSPVYLRGKLPDIPALPPLEGGALSTLRAKGLTYRFPDTENGIADINFTLRQGTFTVITGRIGSGKTTLLRVLLGLLPRESGTVHWNDAPISQPILCRRDAPTPDRSPVFQRHGEGQHPAWPSRGER
jgi:ATP-binding cassette subfamily B protein